MVDGSTLPKAGDTVADKYRIERTIGSGGMSAVYGATHLVTRKRFAIKWLLPDSGSISNDAAQRFIREAQVASRMQHPNVVEVYDVGEITGSFYMVMEWLEGQSLASRLEETGPVEFHEACALLIPCMQGVDEAHAAGVVHRDLKPANIFLCNATKHAPIRAKVLDFGIAKLASHHEDLTTFTTNPGVVMGTPFYLSPEQLRSERIDHRTDVYAMGVLFYEVLAGECPFVADSFGDLVREIATATPRPLRELVPGLPEGVDEVVSCAMARDPLRRFQDLRAMIAALEHLALGGSARELTRFGVPAPAISAHRIHIDDPQPSSTQKLSTISGRRLSLPWLQGPRGLLQYAAAAVVLAGALALLLHRKPPRPLPAADTSEARDARRGYAPAEHPALSVPSRSPTVAPGSASTTSLAAATDPAPKHIPAAPLEAPASLESENRTALETAANFDSNATGRRPKRQPPPHVTTATEADTSRPNAQVESLEDQVEQDIGHNPLDMKLQ